MLEKIFVEIYGYNNDFKKEQKHTMPDWLMIASKFANIRWSE